MFYDEKRNQTSSPIQSKTIPVLVICKAVKTVTIKKLLKMKPISLLKNLQEIVSHRSWSCFQQLLLHEQGILRAFYRL